MADSVLTKGLFGNGEVASRGLYEMPEEVKGGPASPSHALKKSDLTHLVMQTREALTVARASMDQMGESSPELDISSPGVQETAAARAATAAEVARVAQRILAQLQGAPETVDLQVEAARLLEEALLRQRRENSIVAAIGAALLFWYS